MIDIDELMRLREAATPGPWEHKIDDAFTTIHTIEPSVASYVSPADAAYIVTACNSVPELLARIRELEEEIKLRDAQRWADLCNEFDSGGPCPYFGGCPFYGKKCGDIRPEDWIKWLEEKK